MLGKTLVLSLNLFPLPFRQRPISSSVIPYAAKKTFNMYDSVCVKEVSLETVLKAGKGTNLLSHLRKGLEVVSEALQADSISPKATISVCRQGNSFDGSLSSQTSQERGPSHSRYLLERQIDKETQPSYQFHLFLQSSFFKIWMCVFSMCMV